MSTLQPTGATDKQVPEHVLASIAKAAAAKFPKWVNNEHPDARAYNAYQLGAVEYYLSAEPAAPVASVVAEGYEQLREVLTRYVGSNEATADEVFLRFRGGRSWTRAEFVEELRTNGPQALAMMVTMMATAAHLITQDKHFPAHEPNAAPSSKAPLAHREAARDLCYALRDLQPLDSGANDYAARCLILDAFAKISHSASAEVPA